MIGKNRETKVMDNNIVIYSLSLSLFPTTFLKSQSGNMDKKTHTKKKGSGRKGPAHSQARMQLGERGKKNFDPHFSKPPLQDKAGEKSPSLLPMFSLSLSLSLVTCSPPLPTGVLTRPLLSTLASFFLSTREPVACKEEKKKKGLSTSSDYFYFLPYPLPGFVSHAERKCFTP